MVSMLVIALNFFVLHYTSKLIGSSYRSEEIKKVAQDRLRICRNYYFPEIGDFSV